jgi:triacylglycerol lipase
MAPSFGRSGLSSLWGEARAMARQARLLAHDLGESHWSGSRARLVFVHGLYATAGVFRPMREMLGAELGFASSTFSYGLGPGVAELSGRLTGVIERAPGDEPIVLVGHSLGGLVVSDYVQNGNLDPRVVQTITLCAPFRGTRLQSLVPGDAGRDIRADSPLLPLLRAGNTRRRRLPHLTIEAGADGRIEPNARPDFGDYQLVASATHNGILFDERAWRLLTERLASI